MTKKGILDGYLLGQLGNVAKTGVWWTALSPLVYALLREDTAIGAMRLAFNGAMLVLSPFAGALAERVSVRSILLNTTALRFILWCVILPLAWILFESDLIDGLAPSRDALYGTMLGVLFVDGCSVAFANVVDIDMGGLDLLGGQHGITITDELRNRFNSLHEIVFDGSMIILAPGMAAVGIAVQNAIDSDVDDLDAEQTASGTIAGIFSGVFFVFSLMSLFYYGMRIPSQANNDDNGDGDDDDNDAEAAVPQPTQPTQGCCSQVPELFANVVDGMRLIINGKAIRWRLLFMALETALEDAMVAVVVAEYAINAEWFGNGNAVKGNMWTATLIAAGKFAAAIAAAIMHRSWSPPARASGYRGLLVCVFLGSVTTLLLPLSYYLGQHCDNHDAARAVAFASVALFFFFSTAPKVGFMTLVQSLAAKVDASGRVFGFIAVFITGVDALIIMALSAVFQYYKTNVEDALWICAGVYLAHGVLELVLGPCLFLNDDLDAATAPAGGGGGGDKETEGGWVSAADTSTEPLLPGSGHSVNAQAAADNIPITRTTRVPSSPGIPVPQPSSLVSSWMDKQMENVARGSDDSPKGGGSSY